MIGLTRQEKVALDMFLKGETMTAVADELGVSIHVVRNIISDMYRKYRVPTISRYWAAHKDAILQNIETVHKYERLLKENLIDIY